MRVAQMTFSTSGGAGSVASTLNSSLVRRGVDSRLVTLSDSLLRDKPFENARSTIFAAIDEYVVKEKNFPNQISVLRSRNAFPASKKDLEFDILNLHWIPGQIKVPDLMKLTKNKIGLVWTLHDLWPISGGCHYSNECKLLKDGCSNCPAVRVPFRHLVQRENFSKKDTLEKLGQQFAFVAPSEWMANQARNSRVGSNLRIEVISNPVDESSLGNFGDKSTARHKLGIEDHTFVVSFAAANIDDKRKNLGAVLDALEFASSSRPDMDFLLMIVGKGARIEKRNFKVIQTGFLAKIDLAKTIIASDLFVNLSMEENLSIAAIEALALSIPVLAIESGGNSDLVEDGVSGYLVKKNADISSRIIGLASNVLALRQMSKNAYSRFETKFSSEMVSTKYKDLYESFV